ncbi:MAG: NAD(P)/FAD-dependent oxidoreductase, partial [Planctomycetota bacterium]|nr:NAD(P)/FAD-dependent oxidoreductase [Planctomycetota bacterium]
NNTSADQLGNWKQCYDSGVEKFRQLVYAFYDPCFNFADFIRNHPDQRENLTELLVGNVFKPGVSGLFDGINPMLTSA